MKYIIELAAIKKIIPTVRRFLARKYWQGIIQMKREKAILMLQNMTRRRAASLLYSKLKQDSQSQKQRLAAIFIQSTIRSSLAAKEAEYRRKIQLLQQVQIHSAQLLQRSTRNMFARIARKKDFEKAKQLQMIVFIQCRIRTFLAKCRYNIMKKESISSFIIQKAWKRELLKRDENHERKMKAIYKLQQVLRRKWVAFGVMKHAAMLKEKQQEVFFNSSPASSSIGRQEDMMSIQSSALSGFHDEFSVSRMELTVDDEFSLLSPPPSSSVTPMFVYRSLDGDDDDDEQEASIVQQSPLRSPSRDRGLLERNAANKIQVFVLFLNRPHCFSPYLFHRHLQLHFFFRVLFSFQKNLFFSCTYSWLIRYAFLQFAFLVVFLRNNN